MRDANVKSPAARRRSGQGLRLQAKVLISISMVISVVFVSAVAVAMYMIQSDRRVDLETRAEFLADVQSAGLARPIWDFEFGQAVGMLKTLTRDPDFRYAAIEGPDGGMIGAFGEPPRRTRAP